MKRFSCLLPVLLLLSLLTHKASAEPLSLPFPAALQTLESQIKEAGFTPPENSPGTPFSLDRPATITLAEWPGGTSATRIEFAHTMESGRAVEDWRIATAIALRKLDRIPDWPVIFTYRITYDDQKEVTIPVRFGESIANAERVQTVAPMLWARENWVAKLDPATTQKAVVYRMQIPNPRPDAAILRLEAVLTPRILSGQGNLHLFGCRIITQPKDGRLLVVAQRPVGDDAQAATFDAPLGTLAAALEQAQPGDTILLRGGSYGLDAAIHRDLVNTTDKWLTISAFPGETPVLDGQHIRPDYRLRPYTPDAPHDLFYYQQDTGILHFTGDPAYLRIQGITFIQSPRAGISVYGKQNRTAIPALYGETPHVDLSFNTTFLTATMGIITHKTKHLTILGNRVGRPHAYEMLRNGISNEQETTYRSHQEAIDLTRCSEFEVAYNTVYGGSKEAIDVIAVANGSIHHNYILSCLNGIYVDSWDILLHSVEIYRNFIQDAFSGIPLATEGSGNLADISIRGNIIVDSRRNAISISEATYKAQPSRLQHNKAFQNTIYGSGAYSMAIGWPSAAVEVYGFSDNPDYTDARVSNNIITQTEGMPMRNAYRDTAAERNIQFTHNLVWPDNADNTVERSKAQRSYRAEYFEPGENTLVADPLFIEPERGDFRLRAGSPAIGAGSGGEDLGALPFGQSWQPGLDFGGQVTAFYQPEQKWEPVHIAPELRNQFRSMLQRPAWFQWRRYGSDFRNLPAGLQAFAGIPFFIPDERLQPVPSLVVLKGGRSEVTEEAVRIPVAHKASKVAFLHTANIQFRHYTEGTPLCHYRLHFEDGSHADFPVIPRENIWMWQVDAPLELSSAEVVWTQVVQVDKLREQLQLYQFVVENPSPDKAIEAVELLRLPGDADPESGTVALFALSTAE